MNTTTTILLAELFLGVATRLIDAANAPEATPEQIAAAEAADKAASVELLDKIAAAQARLAAKLAPKENS